MPHYGLYTKQSTCFAIKIFFTDTDDLQDSRGREGIIFYSTLPLPPAHEHWDIYLQLCMWDDYHVFLIATLVFTRLLLDEIYHFIELPFEWLIDDAMFICLLDELILGFSYNDLALETGGFELELTITLVLQMIPLMVLQFRWLNFLSNCFWDTCWHLLVILCDHIWVQSPFELTSDILIFYLNNWLINHIY